MLLKKRSLMAVFFLLVFALLSQGCSKGPNYEEALYGPWRMKVASIHTIISFKANGGWTERKKIEKEMSLIEKIEGKVKGSWVIEKSPDDDGISFIVMTPSLVDTAKTLWVKDEPVYLEIVEINEDVLVVRGVDGKEATWSRLRSSKRKVEDEDLGLVKVSMGPVIVNLSKERKYQKDRYICLDLDVELEDIDGIDFVHGTEPDKAGLIVYSLHPRIREVTLLYLSSLTYRDVKTLEKIKLITKNIGKIIDPYLNNKLSDVTVNKVVVTASVENVEDFENQYKAQKAAERAKAEASS